MEYQILANNIRNHNATLSNNGFNMSKFFYRSFSGFHRSIWFESLMHNLRKQHHNTGVKNQTTTLPIKTFHFVFLLFGKLSIVRNICIMC